VSLVTFVTSSNLSGCLGEVPSLQLLPDLVRLHLGGDSEHAITGGQDTEHMGDIDYILISKNIDLQAG